MSNQKGQRDANAPTPSDVWFVADADYMAQFLLAPPTGTGNGGYRGCKRGQTFTVRVLGRLMFPGEAR